MAEPLPVRVSSDGAVTTVTLDRPEKLNVLTLEMLEELGRIADELDRDERVRCVILTGAGERAFCCGADIKAWTPYQPLDMWRIWVRRGHQIFDRWARLRVPVVAAINGHALGGGLELAAAADIRLAATGATFGLPEASIGTVPGWSGTQRLVKLIGATRVKYLALSGRRMDTDQALQAGLLAEPATGEVMQRAQLLARDICAMAPVSVQLVKQLVDAGQGEGMGATLEAIASAVVTATRDGVEGKESFAQRRPPLYQGR